MVCSLQLLPPSFDCVSSLVQRSEEYYTSFCVSTESSPHMADIGKIMLKSYLLHCESGDG